MSVHIVIFSGRSVACICFCLGMSEADIVQHIMNRREGDCMYVDTYARRMMNYECTPFSRHVISTFVTHSPLLLPLQSPNGPDTSLS